MQRKIKINEINWSANKSVKNMNLKTLIKIGDYTRQKSNAVRFVIGIWSYLTNCALVVIIP